METEVISAYSLLCVNDLYWINTFVSRAAHQLLLQHRQARDDRHGA
jgi:hypothetical protein